MTATAAPIAALLAAAEDGTQHRSYRGPDVPTMIVQKALVAALVRVAMAAHDRERGETLAVMVAASVALPDALRALDAALAGGEGEKP